MTSMMMCTIDGLNFRGPNMYIFFDDALKWEWGSLSEIKTFLNDSVILFMLVSRHSLCLPILVSSMAGSIISSIGLSSVQSVEPRPNVSDISSRPLLARIEELRSHSVEGILIHSLLIVLYI
jgi:hypothetical protein